MTDPILTLPSLIAISGEVFDSLPESIRTYIRDLETRINQLSSKVHQLEKQLAKNSSNSGKPPGTDGFKKKTKSLRNKSEKKPGAQQGRTGKGLAQVENPNIIITHASTSCNGCGLDLSNVEGVCKEKRQVFDIPQPKIEVTEHQAVEKKCSCCGKLNRATFPENVKGPVQYGERVQGLAVYFAHQHFIPMERLCQIFEDIFDIALSPGTCANIDEKLYLQLKSFEDNLKTHLMGSEVLHFDETGMRCEKKLHWVHVASSHLATFYTIHTKRGQEAMDEAAILSEFQGIGIHDHWFPYFSYKEMTHGLCNSHHLRELVFIHEQEKENWAKHMMDLLIFAKEEVEKHSEKGFLPGDILRQIEQSYTKILADGFEYHSQLSPLPKGKRGKQKQRDGKNLLDRFNEKRSCVLLFIHNFSVAFTNNQGEQDIRMVKLKQKVSGCFRSLTGGKIFCRIRSYISTARKQGWNIWGALTEAIRGVPRSLEV